MVMRGSVTEINFTFTLSVSCGGQNNYCYQVGYHSSHIMMWPNFGVCIDFILMHSILVCKVKSSLIHNILVVLIHGDSL